MLNGKCISEGTGKEMQIDLMNRDCERTKVVK